MEIFSDKPLRAKMIRHDNSHTTHEVEEGFALPASMILDGVTYKRTGRMPEDQGWDGVYLEVKA